METLQHNLVDLDSIENVLILYSHSILYSLEENKFVYCNKLLPFNMKSIKPIQKYPRVLFSMNFLVSFGICSTPKLSKYVTFLVFKYKAIQ